MGKIARYLNQLTVGNVFDAPEILEAYSTDRSALKIKPKAVALPESTEDICKLMKFCTQLFSKNIELPVAIWGSGLDEGGADLTNGLVISTEKLNRLLEADRRERLVRVQAGITLKELNTALSVNGLTIPIGGHENETIGGLISNCPSDTYAGKYGGVMNYVERIEVVLTNGDVLQTSRLGGHIVTRKAQEKTAEGKIYKKISNLVKEYEDLIDEIRKSSHSSCGYATIAQAVRGGSLDLMPLFFGAEGTLGVITEVILRAMPLPKQPKRVVATFKKISTAQKFLEMVNPMKPRELNVYDSKIIKLAEETGKKLNSITSKLDEGFVVFATFDHKAKSALKKITSVKKVLPHSTRLIIESDKNKAALDEFENSLVSFLNQVQTGERVPLVTDFYIPSENLGDFQTDLKVLEKSLGLETYFYGSFSASNYSLRPKFDVEDEEFSKKAVAFLRAGNFIINRQEGSITGGSPEGRVKAIVANADLPENEKELYLEIKNAFDKNGILNPGAKLGADNRFNLAHFRAVKQTKIVI